MPRVVHVLVPVQDEAHRAAQNVGRHCSRSIPGHTAGLLAPKSTPNALHMAHYLVLGDAQNVRNGLLMLCRRLQTL